MTTAIIVAAGSGQRFGGETPKQFVEICGRPLICHTLAKFEACADIDRILLVLSISGLVTFAALRVDSEFSKLTGVVEGGATRAESVLKGLEAAEAAGDDVIVVHDGARPFVSPGDISAVVARASQTGAACLVAEIPDTVKKVDGQKITGTIDRSTLRRALTPQAFRYEVLARAFEHAGADLTKATDESSLVEQLGVPVAAVEATSQNIKLTQPDDLILAEAILGRENLT